VGRCRELTLRANELQAELGHRVARGCPRLLSLPGCGVLTAAKILAEVAGVGRFRSEAALAMHAGAAPLECSSGAWQRHRLSRVGNRQLNAALHRIAVTQLRVHPPAQAYLLRLQATGKSKREALRVLKRRLVRVIFNLLQADLDQAKASHLPLRCRLTNRPLDIGAMHDRTRHARFGSAPRPARATAPAACRCATRRAHFPA
jgi:transposase